MADVIIYGDGSLYGDADAIYGRVGSGLIAAQAASTRQTHLEVKIIDAQLNKWEYLGGALTYPDENFQVHLYSPLHIPGQMSTNEGWSYRGGTSMCKLGDGTIKRARNGDPTNDADRQVWIQTITDPTVAAQWASWSVLYSGTHYGTPVIISDGTATGFSVVHCKAAGIYIDNVLQWSNGSDFTGQAIGFVPVGASDPGDTFLAGWVITVRASTYDSVRLIDHWWTLNLDTTAPTADPTNYAWATPRLAAFLGDDGKVTRFASNPIHGNAKSFSGLGFAQWTCQSPTLGGELSEPYAINGIGGLALIAAHSIYKFSDGFYYIFGTEVHYTDVVGELMTNFGLGLPIWIRSKDLIHWSEPVVGPDVPFAASFSGVVESGNYVYWATAEFVYRRPIAQTEYDITNFVPKASFSIPRDNQPGSGNLTVANPNGINDVIVDLSDREIVIKPGLLTASGFIESTQFDKFFIKQCNREIKGAVNRIEVEFGNIWDRLDNQIRNVINFVGQIDWQDWSDGKRNKAFNYYFASAQTFTETNDQLRTSGICLYTGWKGNNPDITVNFSGLASGAKPRIILKYIDVNNYIYVEYDRAGDVDLFEVRDGTVTAIADGNPAASDTCKIRVQLKWNLYKVWVNDALVINSSVAEWYKPQPGYVGFAASAGSYTITGFNLKDWEAAVTSEDLIRTALALGDFHDVLVGGADSRILAIIWGPQTDTQTQSDALRQSLLIDKLQLIWRNGTVEIGKFTDQSIVRTIENQIIDSDTVNEAKRRINLAVVDGNEDSWIEVDGEDSKQRGRQIIDYSDTPELLDRDSVIARAREVISQSTKGDSPGGTTPLFFDLWRMDAIEWIDGSTVDPFVFGNPNTVRIEGFTVDIDQGMQPFQRQTFDLSKYSTGSLSHLIVQGPVGHSDG